MREIISLEMKPKQTRVTQISVGPEGSRLFDPAMFDISIFDDGECEVVQVSQRADDSNQLRIDPQGWPTLRKAIDDMIRYCRDAPDASKPCPNSR